MDKVGILVQVIQDLLIERLGEASDRDICKVFNNVVSIADYVKEINVPISSKTEKSITEIIRPPWLRCEFLAELQLVLIFWS